MWALVDDNQKRFINELSDQNESQDSAQSIYSVFIEPKRKLQKLLIEEFDHGSD
ncbi:hypothetical protein VCHC61A2_0765 [Vibrio cholerae HC-61A2]|nr:hypothetical protein VCCP1035_0827 [Vibrio cholerae CP1035(8)]EKL23269.1 hypothetical protein VCHC61A2_0765 [Vibrio cholerae HC-61A2]ERP70373.1 hypothetical protein VCHC36A1_0950 [Vibrio cholerae HC-36A1]